MDRPGRGCRRDRRSHRRLGDHTRKPEWLRPKVRTRTDVLALKKTVREHDLVTVCEDAGCPNLSPSAGPTAPPRSWCSASGAPGRAASAWSTRTSRPARRRRTPRGSPSQSDRMNLDHAVADDRGAATISPTAAIAHVAECVEAIRSRPGDPAIETLDLRRERRRRRARAAAGRRPRRAEPQRRDRRPSAACGPALGRLRPILGVLAAAKAPGCGRRPGSCVGLGECDEEIEGLPRRPRRPRRRHRHDRSVPAPTSAPPPDRALGRAGRVRSLEAARRIVGIGHVEASPLTRSTIAEGAAESVAVRVTVGAASTSS